MSKYRITPRCETSFTFDRPEDFKGSIALVEVASGARHVLYFIPQGCFFADQAEHSGEDRQSFEQGLREAVVEYWQAEVDPLVAIKTLRINYPSLVRRIIAAYPKDTKAGVR